jgi:hypothetical protein
MRNLNRVSIAHRILIDFRIYPTRATRECSPLLEQIIVKSKAWLAAGCQRHLPSNIDYFKTKFWLGWYGDDLLLHNAMPSNWFNSLSGTALLT